ncbi:MAG: hypothetical protein IJ668_00080 [Selenomonadaceae bacterium]|nr:hypothetical protein [Selenomonadaceae bacterium]
MNIAVIDADLLGRKRHRFPNLVCMKLSGYHKERGDTVSLKLDYSDLDQFDRVYIAKVFTDTPIDQAILDKPNVTYGGTGFFYDRAEPLPPEIEHHMPDYHLYDRWAVTQKPSEIKFYAEYSIGYLTRGCFRHCPFCVNRRADKVIEHSPLAEFDSPINRRIALLDDNFLGCERWRELLTDLQATGKRFSFRQGLDARLLDDDKCELLFRSRYDGDFYFSFDSIADKEIIESKLALIRKHTRKQCRFYLLDGFNPRRTYDDAFWLPALKSLLDRIELLKRYDMLGYVMRYRSIAQSPFRVIHQLVGAWCNQPRFFRKISCRQFSYLPKRENDARQLERFLKEYPQFEHYFDQ